MAEIKKISTELQLLDKFLDTSGDAGTSGQVLTSTGTGINWVSGGSLPGGPYLPLAGGTMTGITQFNDHTIYGDQVYAKWGAGNDLTIGHNATNSAISNVVGNLYISNHSDDKDIIFECDNGSGASASYLTLDGSTTHAYFSNPGNVGIGTTSPSAKLHVGGLSANSSGLLLESPTSEVNVNFNFIIGDTSLGLHSKNLVIKGSSGSSDIAFSPSSSHPGLMVLDGSKGNVGIGTSGPIADLQVLSTKDGMTNGLDTNQLKLSYGASVVGAGSSVAFGVSSNLNFTGAKIVHERTASNSVGDLTFWTRQTGGTSTDYDLTIERMRITSAGNVGIGTTSPTHKLTVNAPNDTTAVGIDFPSAHFDFSANSTSGYTTSFHMDDTATTIGSNSAGRALKFQTNNTDRLYINGNTGNVGIGTTSPGTALQVGGLDDGSNYDITVGWNAVSSQAVGTKRSALTFKTSQTGVNNEDIYKWDIAMVTAPATASSEPFGSDLAFLRSTRSSTSVDETTMILTQLGNVGIGTTSPSKKLEVAGSYKLGTNAYIQYDASYPYTISTLNTAAVGNLIFTAGAGSSGYESGITLQGSNTASDDGITFTAGSSAAMVIQVNGNVGIGTTSPLALLSVGSGSLADTNVAVQISTSGGTSQKWFGVNKNGSYGLLMGYLEGGSIGDGGAGAYIRNITEDPLYFMVSNSDLAMTILANKNVGIGTTSPGNTLHVYKNATIGVITSPTVANAGFRVQDSGANMYVDGNSFVIDTAGYLTTTGSNDFDIGTNSTSRIKIKGGGNVGIGTTNPTEKLVVQDGKVLAGHTNTRGYGFHDLSNYTYTANTGRLSLVSNGTEAVSIDSSQNVGIGTTSPQQKLDTPNIIISGSSIAASYRANATLMDNLGGVARFYSLGPNTTTGGSYQFNSLSSNATAGAGAVMTILNSGNVGIGTTAPTNKLHIQGSQATVYSSTDSGGQASAGTTINNTNTSGNTNNFSQLLFTVGTNNNSVSRIVAIRSGSDASDLAFVGKSAAGVAEYMRIKSGGNVGIGINNPSALLEVRKGSISGQIAKFSAINPHVVIESSTAGNAVLHLKPNATSSKSGQFKVTAGNGYNFRWSNDASGTAETAYMDLDTSTTGGGDLTVKGDVIAYGSPSDKKYKENIKPIESALDKAMQLQGVTFDWKDSESILEIKEDIGFIAQDVQEVLPELVRDNGKGNLSLRYQGITPILLEAIKELKAEIEELKLNNCNCNK